MGGAEMGDEGRASPLLHLDLHNFEEPVSRGSRYVLTSPRSLEACARLGVRPVQLLHRSLQEFVHGLPAASLLGAVRLYEEAEKERRKNLHHCQLERQKLLREREQATALSRGKVPPAPAGSRFTAEDPEYRREILKSEAWLRGPNSFTHWGEVPAKKADGGQEPGSFRQVVGKKSWSSGDLSAARRQALQLARDVEREARVSLPARDHKIAALMLARHQEEQKRQEKGLQTARAWEDLKYAKARLERDLEETWKRPQEQPKSGRRGASEKAKSEAQRRKRYRDYVLQEKENVDKLAREQKCHLLQTRQALNTKILKDMEERRRIQGDNEYEKIRQFYLRQQAVDQMKGEEITKRMLLDDKLQKSKEAYELQTEEKNKELKEKAAKELEQMTMAKIRAEIQEEQQRKHKELMLQRTNMKIQQARESVIKIIQEKVGRVREVNAQKEKTHSFLKQRVDEQEEYYRREMEQMIKLKDKKSDQILKEKEAILEESRKIARASFKMRERVREKINSRPFNQMVLEAQLNANLIK